jgi:catechol 2,3-dioxygenase-like lactoylglutathione lyase family enzyme
MRWRTFLPILLAVAAPGLSQTAQPVERNAAGVAFLHIHLVVRNTDAQRSFWLALMDGPPPAGGRGLRVGGASVSIQQGESNGGSDGTAIDHLAFRVRNLKETLAKLEAAGGKAASVAPASTFVTAPEGVKVELIEDASLTSSVVQDHVHLAFSSVAEAQPWYARTLGAVPNPAGQGWVIPGVTLRVAENKSAAPTKGRALDHIAFDVANLDDFCKRLAGLGITPEPITKVGNGARGYTYIIDPWGVYIEFMGPIAP